jgi:hypothetical protein
VRWLGGIFVLAVIAIAFAIYSDITMTRCAAGSFFAVFGWCTTEISDHGRDLGGPTMLARIGVMRALNRHVERVVHVAQRASLGKAEAEEVPMKTVLIYVDTIADASRLVIVQRDRSGAALVDHRESPQECASNQGQM